jgi:hypothetical protein
MTDQQSTVQGRPLTPGCRCEAVWPLWGAPNDGVSAAELPEGSVVATVTASWIKTRSVARPWDCTREPHRQLDAHVDAALDNGAVVLRVGVGMFGVSR